MLKVAKDAVYIRRNVRKDSDMTMKQYTYLWLALTVYITFEYWTLNHAPSMSILHGLQTHVGAFSNWNLSTDAGRPISYLFGWLGITLIMLTNPYVARKKWSPLKKLGTLPGWMNFHIFCGLLGPTLILFHSAGKVRGVVGISFWSMVIVVLSGVIGRYIYVQVLRHERSSAQTAEKMHAKLEKYRMASKQVVSEEDLDEAKQQALAFVGFPVDADPDHISMMRVLFGSLYGDVRLMFSSPDPVPGLPDKSRHVIAEYAVAHRQLIFIEPFRKMLGYWHTFHLPFAIFMYIAAVIHIVSALMFGVSG